MADSLILSILTPSVPERFGLLNFLCAEIGKQIGPAPVEHLVLMDNRRRTIGEKRDALLRAARGRYVAFVDDDDWIRPNYVSALLQAASEQPDVITFLQYATVDDLSAEVEFKLGNPNEPFAGGERIRRNAWHVCAWRRTLAVLSHFPAINYGEDWAFAAGLCGIANLREIHIPEILHEYHHSAESTLAPATKDC